MKTKIIIVIIIVAAAAGLIAVGYYFGFKEREEPVFCIQDAKLCPDGSAVARIPPDCEFAACSQKRAQKENLIEVESPKINETLSGPVLITGKARGYWYFEAEFPIKLYDKDNNLLGWASAFAKSDWMTEDFVPFEANLDFQVSETQIGVLVLEKSNPSDLPENYDELRIPVLLQKSQEPYRQAILYYYKPDIDRDETGNILCSRKGLVAVEREIPLTKTPIQDTINLLLKGELTNEERERGLTTEYPLEGLLLKGASLKNGTLTLEFDDPNNKTGGGSCRVGILWFQIEATAKQFPEVQKVQFLSEELFQP